MNTKRKDYVTYCKDYLIDELKEMRGQKQSHYGCDLGNHLTHGPNVNGSITFSTYEAKEYIKEWFDEAGEVYQYQKDNYGEVMQNPFESPEAFMVCMLIEGVNNILNQCDVISDNWNDNIVWTTSLINKLIKQVEAVTDIEF